MGWARSCALTTAAAPDPHTALRSPKHTRLNLDELRLTTATVRPPESGLFVVSSLFFSPLSTTLGVYFLGNVCSLTRPLCWINPCLPLPLYPSCSGADLHGVCTRLVLTVLEEIKCSSCSPGRIHIPPNTDGILRMIFFCLLSELKGLFCVHKRIKQDTFSYNLMES